MAGEDPEDTIAVVGETVTLRFESEEHFVGDVELAFSILTLDGPPDDPNRRPVFQTVFKRMLPSSRSALGSATGRRVSIVSWVVELPQPDLRLHLCIVAFEASGTVESGRRLKARSLNRLRVPGIAITAAPELTSIMLHEFAKPLGGGVALDTGALDRRLSDLTLEQRKLLASYDVGQRAGRLVVFVTFQAGTDRLMFADNCSGAPTSVHANASLTVFACRGKGEQVTLVCHTDHFVINTNNPDTQKLFSGLQGNKGADQWLSPTNAAPPKFMCASHATPFTDGVVWSRLFTPRGIDVMPGNAIHGIINTVGCWMLFRNYNWPVSVRTELFRAYISGRVGRLDVGARLAAAGYDQATSFDKFLNFDLNYAYNFFFRHVVGVQFFAETSEFYARFANLHNTSGLVFENSIDPANLLTDRFLYHDFVTRKRADPSFSVTDSLFANNALGFKTAEGFLSAAQWKQNLPVAQLNQRSWSDWYFFKPLALGLRTALSSPVGRVP